MKKKLTAILAMILVITIALSGCGMGFSKIKIADDFKQEYNYVVRSNGGNAVQYGEYIYFINGTRGYDDTDAKSNVWGKVTKGALYKAKLLGSRNENNNREWTVERNANTGLYFQSTLDIVYKDKVNEDLEDKDKETIDVVDVQLIAPKVIGTSGYEDGGIFIYDDFVYYATPHNTKNKSGVVQTERTDFMRTKLDGSLTQLIFTTEGASSDKPYGFFKQNDAVYLVCYYDTKIVSVKMPSANTKIGKAMLITDEATSVIFPKRDVYDSENYTTNDPEDFIYYTRAIKDEDNERAGNVVVVCRPDGTESFNAFMTGKEIKLEAVRGGGLFYRITELTMESLRFDNLHNALMLCSPTYKAAEEAKTATHEDPAMRSRLQVDMTVYGNLSDYTAIYPFRDNLYSNQCYVLAFASNSVFLLSNAGYNIRILPYAAEMQFIQGNMLYYTKTDSKTIYRTDYTKVVTNKTDADYEEFSHIETTPSGLKADYVAGFVFYFGGTIDEWASDYGYFKYAVTQGAEAKEVYARDKADEKPEEDETDDTTDDTTTE